jgi:hypothetical protein
MSDASPRDMVPAIAAWYPEFHQWLRHRSAAILFLKN